MSSCRLVLSFELQSMISVCGGYSPHATNASSVELLTRVRSAVLPAPLGPINTIEGKDVKPVARKTTEWRNIGIERTRIIVMIKPNGEGFIRV